MNDRSTKVFAIPRYVGDKLRIPIPLQTNRQTELHNTLHAPPRIANRYMRNPSQFFSQQKKNAHSLEVTPPAPVPSHFPSRLHSHLTRYPSLPYLCILPFQLSKVWYCTRRACATQPLRNLVQLHELQHATFPIEMIITLSKDTNFAHGILGEEAGGHLVDRREDAWGIHHVSLLTT